MRPPWLEAKRATTKAEKRADAKTSTPDYADRNYLLALLALVEALADVLESATIEEDPDVWQAEALAVLERYRKGPA